MKDNAKLLLHMKVLAAIDFAPGKTIKERMQSVSQKKFEDENGNTYQFTWRTISTWHYRYLKNGITSMKSKPRSDKGHHRKVSVEQVAEAINEVKHLARPNKRKKNLKTVFYRLILEKGLITRSQLAPTTYYRMVKDNNLLADEENKKRRLAFAMLHANELWQVDTMVGNYIPNGKNAKERTYLIAFIDDASRLITHAEFYFHDNADNLAIAFQTALYKRGKPQILYCDNGSNYKSQGIKLACLRLGIKLCHAPIRDGASKGKIERFFRTFRDQFLTKHYDFKSLEDLNRLTSDWIENDYNNRIHSSIQMKPIDRFGLDRNRIEYLPTSEFLDEIFFVEKERKVEKNNTFQLNNVQYEAPVNLRGQKIHVRFHPKKRDKILVFFKDQKMGEAQVVNLYINSKIKRIHHQGEK